MALSSDSDLEEMALLESSSSSSDDEVFELMEEEAQMVMQVAIASSSSFHLFNGNEWTEGGFHTVNREEGVRDVLASMRTTPTLFKGNTNFTLPEFDELCALVTPFIVDNARSTGEGHISRGRPMKLSPEQRLLNFILYLKHDNITLFDTYLWNYSKSAVCDDTIFIASCINEALRDEIKWPSEEERVELGQCYDEFPGCIG
jgi:hypothetical protein